MEQITTIALYVFYTVFCCWLITRIRVPWGKLLVTAVSLAGLASLPALARELALLVSTILSAGLLLLIYGIGLVLLIRCIFPRFGR